MASVLKLRTSNNKVSSRLESNNVTYRAYPTNAKDELRRVRARLYEGQGWWLRSRAAAVPIPGRSPPGTPTPIRHVNSAVAQIPGGSSPGTPIRYVNPAIAQMPCGGSPVTPIPYGNFRVTPTQQVNPPVAQIPGRSSPGTPIRYVNPAIAQMPRGGSPVTPTQQVNPPVTPSRHIKLPQCPDPPAKPRGPYRCPRHGCKLTSQDVKRLLRLAQKGYTCYYSPVLTGDESYTTMC